MTCNWQTGEIRDGRRRCAALYNIERIRSAIVRVEYKGVNWAQRGKELARDINKKQEDHNDKITRHNLRNYCWKLMNGFIFICLECWRLWSRQRLILYRVSFVLCRRRDEARLGVQFGDFMFDRLFNANNAN